jgi:hypothetical protein
VSSTGFDPACLELAEHFNDRELTPEQLARLAQDIQDAVESYFLDLDIHAARAALDACLVDLDGPGPQGESQGYRV